MIFPLLESTSGESLGTTGTVKGELFCNQKLQWHFVKLKGAVHMHAQNLCSPV